MGPRSPASSRAIRRSGPKAAAPGKRPPKTTKPPPITQEDDGFGDLASEEEEFDEDDVDDEEFDANGIAAHDEATRESISARTRGAKRDGDANDRTDGGRPKIALLKTTGDLAYDDEELDDGGTEYEEDLKDDGRTALTV